MALIIKGERPKGNCWWHDDDGKEHECMFFPCHAYETIGSDNMTHCPIVCEIPDTHGRIIDADKVIKVIEARIDNIDRKPDGTYYYAEDAFFINGLTRAIQSIKKAPTIVEASE